MRQVKEGFQSIALRAFAAAGSAHDEADEDALKQLEAHGFDGGGKDGVSRGFGVDLDQLVALLVVVDHRLGVLVEGS